MPGLRKHGTVLVVDDAPDNILLLKQALAGDFTVLAATSGEQALDIAFGATPPDIVLLDVVMPGMDGYEVCRRLKADARTDEIPVLFVTAMGDDSDEAKGLELGAIDYIAKPVNPGLVRARVRNQFALREAARLKEDVERIIRHDLKTPLTSVMTLPRVLLGLPCLDEDHRDMLKRIEDSAFAMLRLINFSLDLFKMERGAYRFEPARVDLAQVLDRIFYELAELAETRQAPPRLFIDGEPAARGASFPVIGDDMLCYSMLANLVRNALEASPPGETVRVELRGGDPARVEVANSGAVPAEMRERFFEKYATFGKEQGTGLGTYSAWLAARVMGGGITFTSSEAEGTVVTVTLPAAGGDGETDAAPD